MYMYMYVLYPMQPTGSEWQGKAMLKCNRAVVIVTLLNSLVVCVTHSVSTPAMAVTLCVGVLFCTLCGESPIVQAAEAKFC